MKNRNSMANLNYHLDWIEICIIMHWELSGYIHECVSSNETFFDQKKNEKVTAWIWVAPSDRLRNKWNTKQKEVHACSHVCSPRECNLSSCHHSVALKSSFLCLWIQIWISAFNFGQKFYHLLLYFWGFQPPIFRSLVTVIRLFSLYLVG